MVVGETAVRACTECCQFLLVPLSVVDLRHIQEVTEVVDKDCVSTNTLGDHRRLVCFGSTHRGSDLRHRNRVRRNVRTRVVRQVATDPPKEERVEVGVLDIEDRRLVQELGFLERDVEAEDKRQLGAYLLQLHRLDRRTQNLTTTLVGVDTGGKLVASEHRVPKLTVRVLNRSLAFKDSITHFLGERRRVGTLVGSEERINEARHARDIEAHQVCLEQELLLRVDAVERGLRVQVGTLLRTSSVTPGLGDFRCRELLAGDRRHEKHGIRLPQEV